MNQNKSEEMHLGLSIGLVCLIEESFTVVCTLCGSEAKFSKLLNFLSHITQEHGCTNGSDGDYMGKIRSEVIDEDLLDKCNELKDSFEKATQQNYAQRMEASKVSLQETHKSTPLKKLQKLTNETNTNGVKHEIDNCNMVEVNSKEFYCHNCKVNFLSRKEVVDHICNNISPTYAVQNQPNHADEHNYFCDICNKTFSTLKGFRTHKTRIHQDANKFYCEKCDIDFSSEIEQLSHVCSNDASSPNDIIEREDGTTAINNNNKFRCTICSAKLKTSTTLTAHMKTHNSNKPFKCMYCPQSYIWSSRLKEHLQTHEPSSGKTLSCPHCPAILKTRATLNYHLLRHIGEKSFKCDYCDCSFYTPSKMREHVKKKHTTSFGKDGPNFKCAICKEIFSTVEDLRTHKTRTHPKIHQNENKLNCGNCNANFSSESELLAHICSNNISFPADLVEKVDNTSVIGNNTTYCCTICSAILKSSFSLKRHMKIHDENKPFKCMYCPQSFIRNSQLKVHLQTHEPTESTGNTLSCPHCPATLKSRETLRHHLIIHTGQKSFKCEYCNCSYYTPSKLREHLKRSHAAVFGIEFRCAFCSAILKSQKSLNLHLMKHKGEKPYKCKHCSRAFYQSDKLKRHVLIHSGKKPFKCEQCSRAFISSDKLKKHIITHSGNKTYKCDQCSSSFYFKHRLKEHMVIHSGKKPYKCEQCSRSFYHLYNLKLHISSHSGKRPYKCEHCMSSFTTTHRLKRHMDKQHTKNEIANAEIV